MRIDTGDVGGQHIGFAAIPGEIVGAFHPVHRIEYVEDGRCPRALPLRRKGQPQPRRRMGILPAIFTDTWRISLDVAGVARRLIEGRPQKPDQPVRLADQLSFSAGKRRAGAIRRSGAGQHRPGLCNGIDAAFFAVLRPPEPPVIINRAHVPVAVPSRLVDRPRHVIRPVRPVVGEIGLLLMLGQPGKSLHARDGEPCQPDGLAAPLSADAIHAVIPVTGLHQRQTVHTLRDALFKRALAVLEDRVAFALFFKARVAVIFFRSKRRRTEEGYLLIED